MKDIPRVTVVMPIYNSKKYLREAILSIINQTYPNWELLAINEFGSNDGSADIVNEYSAMDNRIILIQNEKKLGLAESINKGLRLARGEYIARMDADDLSNPFRLEKQLALMDADKSIGICGSYQHHFGPNIDWIHKPPISPDECKANLLFDCDLCHSTVMLRKNIIFKYDLFYDENYLAEDFELWTRAIRVTNITNIPEVLGKYRWGENNITAAKKEKLAKEHSYIVAKSLKNNLNIEIASEEYQLLEGWHNPFKEEKDKKQRRQMYKALQDLLTQIYYANKTIKFYDDAALLNIMASKWRHIKYYEPRNVKRQVDSLDEIFSTSYIPNIKLIYEMFLASGPSFSSRFKKIIMHIAK